MTERQEKPEINPFSFRQDDSLFSNQTPTLFDKLNDHNKNYITNKSSSDIKVRDKNVPRKSLSSLYGRFNERNMIDKFEHKTSQNLVT